MHLADRDYAPSPLNGRPLPRNTRVAIVGAGHGRQDAPLDDPTWRVWALNLVAPLDSLGRLRADAWFDLHQRVAQSADDLRWIAKCPVPIYVPDDLLDAGLNCVRYPIEAVEAQMGGYWACSFAYQIALALFMGVSDIGLYGVELAWGTLRERTVEWACVSWWVGFAEGCGATIHLPATSRLGRHSFRYGLEYDEEKADVEAYVESTEALVRRDESAAGIGG